MNLKKILSALVAGAMALSASAFSVMAADEDLPYTTETYYDYEVTDVKPMSNYATYFNKEATNTNDSWKLKLDVAMLFAASNELEDIEDSEYANYNVDFTIKFNNDCTAILAGNYGIFGWIAIADASNSMGIDGLTDKGYRFNKDEEVRVLKAFEKTMTYKEVIEQVGEFLCGVQITNAPEGTVATLNLNLYETKIDETNSLVETGEHIELNSFTQGPSTLELRSVDGDNTKYDLYLTAEENEVIRNFVSGEFTVDVTAKDTQDQVITPANFDYEIESVNNETTISYIKDENGVRTYKVYLNSFEKGKSWTSVDETSTEFKLGTLTINSTATGTIELKEIVMNKHDGKEKGENLAVEMDTSAGEVVTFDTLAPTHDLTINVTFNNKIKGAEKAYNDMWVVINGGDLNGSKTYDLGTDNLDNTGIAWNETTCKYTVTVPGLTDGREYNVTVSGEGYRTARYTVKMDDAKTLNFWNNVKDVEEAIEKGNDSSKESVTFLAGDIVKDNVINVLDLSAVVSYFGMSELSATNNDTYVTYDLNRDTKIDSRDVAYVLVSWGK